MTLNSVCSIRREAKRNSGTGQWWGGQPAQGGPYPGLAAQSQTHLTLKPSGPSPTHSPSSHRTYLFSLSGVPLPAPKDTSQ